MKKSIIIIFVILIIAIIAIFLLQNIFNSGKSDISWAKTNIKVWYINKNYHLCRIDTDAQNNLCTEQKIKDRFVFSPDGKFIAFVAWGKNENDSALYIINTNNFSLKGLVLDSKEIADNIEWSPDSNYIAYNIHDTDTNNDGKIDYLDKDSIYLFNLKTGENILLAKGVIDRYDPFYWFKDSKHLYFGRKKLGGPEYYIKINIKTRAQKQIADSGENGDPRILDYIDNDLLHFNQENGSSINSVSNASSDGKTIYSERGSIFVDGKELIKFKGSYDSKFNSGFSIPQWLPDNKHIIFEGACDQSFLLSFFQPHRCIFIADFTTGRFGKLTEGNNAGVYQGD